MGRIGFILSGIFYVANELLYFRRNSQGKIQELAVSLPLKMSIDNISVIDESETIQLASDIILPPYEKGPG